MKSSADFDSTKAIVAALVVGAVGNLLFMGAPFVVGALVDHASFSEQQAGWVFSADMGGLAIGSVITYFVVNRYPRHYLALIGFSVFIVTNALSILAVDSYLFFFIRVAAGIGSGVLYSLSVANISCTSNTARNFGVLLFLILAEGAILALLLPKLTSLVGAAGVFGLYSIVALVTLPCAFWLTRIPNKALINKKSIEETEKDTHSALPIWMPGFYLFSIVVFTLVVGVVWTYIERAGIATGIEPVRVGQVISLGNLCGIAGALVAANFARRWGQGRMLLFSLFAIALVFLVMGVSLTSVTYLTGILLFNVLWVFVSVCQMGTLAHLDHTGQYGALVPCAQNIAAASGSALGGAMLAYRASYESLFLVGSLFAILSFIVFLRAYLTVRKYSVSLADAP